MVRRRPLHDGDRFRRARRAATICGWNRRWKALSGPPTRLYLLLPDHCDRASGKAGHNVTTRSFSGTMCHLWFWLAALLLLIPPIFHTIRAAALKPALGDQRLSTHPHEEANLMRILAT